MNPTLNKIIHGAILALFLVSGLGPFVSSMVGVLPAPWVADLARIVAVATGLTLYVMSSPFLQPFLPVHSPVQLVAAAVNRAASDGVPIPRIPPVMGLTLCLVLAALLPGCAGLSQAMVDQLKADAAKDATAIAACVLGQVVSGNESAVSIGITCGTPNAILIAQQLAVVLEKPASDAGVGAAPATDRLTLALRLRAVR